MSLPGRTYASPVLRGVAWALAISLPAFLLGAAVTSHPASATDPEEICIEHDALISQLTGKPHFERQALLLMDEIPSQRHRIELFMNSGEGGRHSYSLVRTRRGGSEACIVSAGLVEGRDTDTFGHPHLTLKDENDPETFDFVGCDGRYVMFRTTALTEVGESVDVCENVKALALTPRLVVSYGQIAEDHRAEIPWPK